MGGYDEGLYGNACEIESAGAHSSSSWGGATTGSFYNEGKGRSIVDVAGAFTHDLVAASSASNALSQYSGTSAATPSVGSIAVGVIDMFKTHIGTSFVDNPGVLYAWMLNMGDRANSGTTKIKARFDHRLGAGRLGARFLAAEGMDSPWLWGHYALCVGDNATVSINIDGGSPLGADYDRLRAVAWWYDARHEVGIAIDDIDLRLYDTGSSKYIRSSLDSYDNKERVYHGNVGGRALRLDVIGADVTANNAGCGANKMKVYVTYMIEDDDRDDANGPTYNSSTCEGVENL